MKQMFGYTETMLAPSHSSLQRTEAWRFPLLHVQEDEATVQASLRLRSLSKSSCPHRRNWLFPLLHSNKLEAGLQANFPTIAQERSLKRVMRKTDVSAFLASKRIKQTCCGTFQLLLKTATQSSSCWRLTFSVNFPFFSPVN
jgi:hypothetical protein